MVKVRQGRNDRVSRESSELSLDGLRQSFDSSEGGGEGGEGGGVSFVVPRGALAGAARIDLEKDVVSQLAAVRS
jgi:hypothetical protein